MAPRLTLPGRSGVAQETPYRVAMGGDYGFQAVLGRPGALRPRRVPLPEADPNYHEAAIELVGLLRAIASDVSSEDWQQLESQTGGPTLKELAGAVIRLLSKHRRSDYETTLKHLDLSLDELRDTKVNRLPEHRVLVHRWISYLEALRAVVAGAVRFS